MNIYHTHHIIPKHAGGTDEPSNLIKLTVEEHAEAHRILFEKFGRKEDELAWKGLSGHIGKEELIIELIKHVNTGRKHSIETNEKKRKALLGKSLDDLHSKEKAEEIRNKLRKPKTQEHKKNLSISKTGHTQSPETITKRINKLVKKYKIIDPNGNIYLIEGLNNFCRRYSLDRSAMAKVSRGIHKHHKGWICEKN
jgi:hypothetical protein